MIVARVDVSFDRQVSLIRISVFGDLRAEDQLRSIVTPIVASLDIFGAVVDDESIHFISHELDFFASAIVYFLERDSLWFHFSCDVFSGFYIHGGIIYINL